LDLVNGFEILELTISSPTHSRWIPKLMIFETKPTRPIFEELSSFGNLPFLERMSMAREALKFRHIAPRFPDVGAC